MAVPEVVASVVGSTVDSWVPGDVWESGCCVSMQDELAAGDDSCCGALDASWVLHHGRHGDWWWVAGDGGWILWESSSPL